jgi:CRP-like cAMP-binding protein
MMIKKSTLELVIQNDLSEIWSILNSDEKRRIVENFSIHSFKKNQIIYAEKEEPEYLWCLLKGKVRLYKDGIGGRQQILRLLRPVQYFGYRAYFAGEPYVSTAAAFEASVLGSIPMSLVKELIQNNMKLAWFFIHELSRNLGGSDTRIVNLTQKHIRGRLAEAILALSESYGFEDDNATIKIYMSREDLANLSNMTTSNAIRTLSGFVNEKILIVDGRRIKIINEAALRKISKFG